MMFEAGLHQSAIADVIHNYRLAPVGVDRPKVALLRPGLPAHASAKLLIAPRTSATSAIQRLWRGADHLI